MDIIHIPADPMQATSIDSLPAPFTAAGLAEAIGCRLIEVVRTRLLHTWGAVMVVDETGLVTDAPINPRASLLTQRFIHGDVLICGEVDTCEGPDLVGLPAADQQLSVLNALFTWIGER